MKGNKRTSGVVILALALVFALAACDSKTPMQRATGAGREQAAAMEQVLEACGIVYETVQRLNLPDTPAGYELYEVMNNADEEYRMLVNANSKEVALVLNAENGAVLYGDRESFSSQG